MMEVCSRNKETDSEKVVWRSVQQPPSSTYSRNKQSPLNRAEENSNSISTECPCTSTTVDTHSTKSDPSQGIRSSMKRRVKRKMGHYDDSQNKRTRKYYTDSSSHNFTRAHHVPPVWRKESAEQPRPSHSTHNQTHPEGGNVNQLTGGAGASRLLYGGRPQLLGAGVVSHDPSPPEFPFQKNLKKWAVQIIPHHSQGMKDEDELANSPKLPVDALESDKLP
ncbi:hypothetical protein INR49_023698, partial [Caranx melampygus]